MAAVEVQSFLLLTISFWCSFTSAAHVPTAAPAVAPAAIQLSPPEPKVLPAAAPPGGHEDIIKILEKAGGFTVLVRLMRSSHVADQINSQLKDLNDGLTVFAPTDIAFASLRTGALNKLSDKEQVELMQYHVVPTLLTMSQFETVSNPLMTKAGGSRIGEFPLNVTTNGDKVSLYTDTNEAILESTVYVDSKLAVYQVRTKNVYIYIYISIPLIIWNERVDTL